MESSGQVEAGSALVALPRLILVGGAPASGKSTLVAHLVGQFGLPLIAKDAIKEVLFDVLGSPDRERSRQLSGAAYALVWATTSWLLDAGVGAIVDCNFHRGPAEANLRPLTGRARAVLLHCVAPPRELVRRYVARAAQGARHPGHHDSTNADNVAADVLAGTYEPLDLAVPTLLIDTTAGYTPDLPEIVAFVRAATTSGAL